MPAISINCATGAPIDHLSIKPIYNDVTLMGRILRSVSRPPGDLPRFTIYN